MDLNHFYFKLKSLAKQGKLNQIVEEAMLQKNRPDEIIKCIIRFTNQTKTNQLFCFQIIDAIALRANQQKLTQYLRSLANNIKNIISDVCKYSQNFQQVSKIDKIIDKWNQKKVFHYPFILKLKQRIKPFLDKFKDIQLKKVQQTTKITTYNKTFLVDYQIIESFQPTFKIYKNELEWQKLEKKFRKFNKEYEKIEFERTQQSKPAIAQLYRMGNEYKKDLIQFIKSLHQSQASLSSAYQSTLDQIKSNLD